MINTKRIKEYYNIYFEEIKNVLINLNIPEKFNYKYNNLVFCYFVHLKSLINNIDKFKSIKDFKIYYYKALNSYSEIMLLLELLNIENEQLTTDYSYFSFINPIM